MFELELNTVNLKHALVLTHQCILRSRENVHESNLVELRHGSHNRQSANELGNEPKLVEVLWQHFAEEVNVVTLAVKRGAEADAVLACAVRDDLLEPGESSRNDEEHIGRVDLNELLVRMFAATLRRNGSDSSFQNFEESLLNALTGNVTSDRRVFCLACDLV